MTTYRIVVASREGARFFERAKLKEPLRVTEELVHPGGKLRNQDLVSDKPGRSDDNRGRTRHAFSSTESPREHELRTFAKIVVGKLDEQAQNGEFGKLILVAEPHLLGIVRGETTPRLKKILTASIAKDLWHASTEEIAERTVEFR